MKKKIEIKIRQIEHQMSLLETEHLYYLKDEWKLLHAQRQVLGEVLLMFPTPKI